MPTANDAPRKRKLGAGRKPSGNPPTPTRPVRLSADLWDYCKTQAGGAAAFIRGLIEAHREQERTNDEPQ